MLGGPQSPSLSRKELPYYKEEIMTNNTIVIGDDGYEVTKAYREGALAMRAQTPWNCCPVSGTRREEWEHGHCNESAGEHIRFGKDLIAQPRKGILFREDPDVPRDEFGVIKEWYCSALQAVSAVAH